MNDDELTEDELLILQDCHMTGGDTDGR